MKDTIHDLVRNPIHLILTVAPITKEFCYIIYEQNNKQ